MRDDALTIFLAEDDEGHAALIRRNIQRTRLDADIVRVRDGQELPDRIAAPAALGSGRRALVVLDISMPRVDGVEVLRRIKSDPATRTIPVYMLTTTDNPIEIDRCFDLGCNAYLTKPVAYEAFMTTVQRLCDFLEVAQLPGAAERSRHVLA
jgi:CheY-like chemotaxis protein